MKCFTTIQRFGINFQRSRAFMALLFILSISAASTAQDLADFKACASTTGIASIPYDDEKSNAQRAEDAKKSAESAAISKFSVKALTDNLKNAKKKLADEQKVLATAEKALADAKKYHPSVIANEEKAVKTSKDKIEDLEAEVKVAYTEIEYGMNHWNQLAISRGKVRIAFDEVLKRLDESEDDPEEHIGDKPSNAEELKKWNADLALLKGYINTIRDKMETSQEGHKEAEDNAYAAVENLKNL